MAKQPFDLEVAFFRYLWAFYQDQKGSIKSHYHHLSKKFLDFNDPDNAEAFLRRPQFEALEVYVFLKEFLQNKPVHKLFEDWYFKRDKFANRKNIEVDTGQVSLFGELDHSSYEKAFQHIKKYSRHYPNFIFALTMGTGKTILMATCIFYEFLLANKFPQDPLFCHNALVFAPDKTVLQSLKEIQTFDKKKVIPPEYVNWLESHVKFHFLENSGITLNTLDRSRFNIIISNTQKIILKRRRAEKGAAWKLFESQESIFEQDSPYEEFADLYNFDTPEDETELTVNQRFQKLQRLEQLGIYVDEAHHAFGNTLKRDMVGGGKTSLRLTIDELAASLKRSGTRVVACYNYTGTPYVGNEVLPEVVYAYGLKEAIDNEYLKKVLLNGYSNPKSEEFVRVVIEDFWKKYGQNGQLHEGMLPKLALFAPTIAELQDDLRPAVEKVLGDMGIDTNKVLVNVGDPKLTSNDDIREFNGLDTASSEKQFILLVNKGREGWNCRSLFGVGLYRKPKSKIFVLQATMRCLRSIGEGQQIGSVYLSKENMDILNAELQQNYRLTLNQFRNAGTKKEVYQVKVMNPPPKIPLKQVKELHKLKEKPVPKRVDFEIDQADVEKYKLIHTEQEGLKTHSKQRVKKTEEDISEKRIRRAFSVFTLTAEIARYLNRSPLEIENILRRSGEGIEKLLGKVNEYNELVYDWIIPRLFKELYEVERFKMEEEEEVALVKVPEKGFYEFHADPNMVIKEVDEQLADYIDKSFHVDTYCFDSVPERDLFWPLIKAKKVNKIYFTGMLTHGQSDFRIHYIDPDSHAVRSYYPDFVLQKEDGTWLILEVKGDHLIDEKVTQAKRESAKQLASASSMIYEVIPSSSVNKGGWRNLVG